MKTPDYVRAHRKAAGLRCQPFRVRVKPNSLGLIEQLAVPRVVAKLFVGRTLWAILSPIGNTLVFPPKNETYWKQSPWFLPDGSFKRVKKYRQW